MPAEIHILNGSSIRDKWFRDSLHTLGSVFGVPVYLERSTLELSKAYDNLRKQNNSTALLAQLLESSRDPSRKRIAVVDVDLFIPVLTFVFGEAQLGGPAAIVSTHRLSNSYYGLPRDDALLLQRLEKELVHELGHTFGLYHCHQFECVMRSSTYVEEIDMKRAIPCPHCASELAAGSPAGARQGNSG